MTIKEFSKIYKMKSGKGKTLVESKKDIRHFVEALIEIFKDGKTNNLSFDNFGRFYTEEIERTYIHPITKNKIESKKTVLRFKPNMVIMENKSIED